MSGNYHLRGLSTGSVFLQATPSGGKWSTPARPHWDPHLEPLIVRGNQKFIAGRVSCSAARSCSNAWLHIWPHRYNSCPYQKLVKQFHRHCKVRNLTTGLFPQLSASCNTKGVRRYRLQLANLHTSKCDYSVFYSSRSRS
jgi:hypothetical protein